jgi:ribosomal protein S18 acetylase RimI-like enzyme
MDAINIRACTITHSPHILPILDTHVEAFDYFAKRRIVHLVAKNIDENPKDPPVFLAHHEGVVVGFIGFFFDPEDPSLCELFGQAVKHGYQGQGIGTKLLRHGINHITDHGAAQVNLQIKASIPQYVHHFYQRAGFKPSFDESYTGASDENRSFILTLKLTQATVPDNFYPA